MLKREVNLTGRPLQPILRGRPAVIREPPHHAGAVGRTALQPGNHL